MIKIIIINGSGGVGKDQFITYVKSYCDFVENYSSVDKIKEAATILGWNPMYKTEKDRLFLSNLKLLSTEYCDLPFEYLKQKVNEFTLSLNFFEKGIIFLHVREPSEIQKIKEYYKDNCIVLLVINNRIKHIQSNMADDGVYDYTYELVVENRSTLEELRLSAKTFVNYIWNIK